MRELWLIVRTILLVVIAGAIAIALVELAELVWPTSLSVTGGWHYEYREI